jgi:hypothetical protein
MSGFNRDVNEVFVLLGCYAALVGSYRLLGTVYQSHPQGAKALFRKVGNYAA